MNDSSPPEVSGLSRDPRTGLVLLAVALAVGGPLLREIHRTIGLGAPRFWTLLRDDRVFDVAMLDFALTAGWAFLVLSERSGRKDWRFWAAMATFLVVPSVGIGLFLVLKVGRGRDSGSVEVTPTPPSALSPQGPA